MRDKNHRRFLPLCWSILLIDGSFLVCPLLLKVSRAYLQSEPLSCFLFPQQLVPSSRPSPLPILSQPPTHRTLPLSTASFSFDRQTFQSKLDRSASHDAVDPGLAHFFHGIAPTAMGLVRPLLESHRLSLDGLVVGSARRATARTPSGAR